MRKPDSLSQPQLKIRKKIEKAFSETPLPSAAEIVTSNYPEPLMIREFFSGKFWQEITLENLCTDYEGDHSVCLTFMSPTGRNYYLPAYLLIATEHYYEGDMTSQYLPSRLLMYAKDDIHFKITTLDHQQMEAVAEALRFIVSEYDDEDALEALDFLWEKYLPQPWHNSP